VNRSRTRKRLGGIVGLAGLLLASPLLHAASPWAEGQGIPLLSLGEPTTPKTTSPFPTAPLLTLSLAAPTHASPRNIWKDGVGDGFREDTFHAGFALGAGLGVRAFGSTIAHDLALASVNLGWIFTDVVAEDKWYRGNWEWLNELFSGGQFNPDGRYFVGWTTGLRYNFATGNRWIPFIDGGVGLSGTDIDSPDLDGIFQFNVQFGVGTHYFFRDDTALTLQYRWLHFSDGGTTAVNHGTNTQMLLAGLTWFF
jgi:lipid A 3-O-deacylase